MNAQPDTGAWWARLDAAAAQLGACTNWPCGELFARDLPLAKPGQCSANGTCRLYRAADGWIALNLARADDVALLSALFEAEIDDPSLHRLADMFMILPVAHWRARATLLGLPLGVVGEAEALEPALLHASKEAPPRQLANIRVLDLSALWAGPLCGALLAAGGAQVTKWQDPARPDPTAQTTPLHAARLNGVKKHRVEPLNLETVACALHDTDILITSARPAALARLGLEPERVFAAHPHLLWVAISAYGWAGEAGQRVGFGDDCAAAGGLVAWQDSAPQFMGDALADPLTGLVAATAALEARAHGRGGLLDCALAPTAAMFSDEKTK
ncbi:MAG: CoA transferase [Alphaproteobacteria bacterium]|nr:CoA transferase [Alphaproteobacteria bacterium]